MKLRSSISTVVLLTATAIAAPPDAAGPRSPREEQATFDIVPGFRIDLVASEPEVVDPVAMCFDERGRLYVCEMRGYPNGGVGTGNENRGRIRCLSDRDGDGTFETAHTFADGLRFPMGVTPWKGGILVAVAPDILYLEDTDGDGTADRRSVFYTGFNLANIQQMVNGLCWGLDNRIHGLGGSNAGTISSPAAPMMPAATLRSRGFRFNPADPASFEPMSGGGQYGITADDAGHWFTATNSNHIRQMVIPDEYLRRNPAAPVTSVTSDISDHGTSCQLFRTSPFEAWRVERTARRAGGADASRFRSTELVAGGFSSSTCSPIVYSANLFPKEYRGSVFVCDPGNNLVHRDVLSEAGSTFTARRGEAEREFLTSTDNWFRPVDLEVGPDGAIYLLDFYREVIETPLSLPDDIKAKLNLESRRRGRIWRIAPKSFRPGRLPDLSRMTSGELVAQLKSSNSWTRLTAQRLLVERNDRAGVSELKSCFAGSAGSPSRANILSMIDHFNELDDDTLAVALSDSLSGNRIVALKLAESRLADRPSLRAAANRLANDPSQMVRFQLALSSWAMPPRERGTVLSRVLATSPTDPWLQSAILLSLGDAVGDMLLALRESSPEVAPFVVKLASTSRTERTHLLKLAADSADRPGFSRAVLEGVGLAMKRNPPTLAVWLTNPPAEDRELAKRLLVVIDAAVTDLSQESAPLSTRLGAARLLAFAPDPQAIPALSAVVTPTSPPDLQLAAVRGLGAVVSPEANRLLLAAWPEAGPTLRRELLEQLCATTDRAAALLDAIEAGKIRPSEIEPVRIAQLKASRVPAIRDRAEKLFARTPTEDRKAILAKYVGVAELKGDSVRGRVVFQKQCATCHKLGPDGREVGPNLLAVVPGKSTADLLTAILDPNREVDPRFVNYTLTTVDGKALTGIVASDTAGSVTLRRADAAEDTIPRGDIDVLKSTGISLMPEGMEKTIPPQDAADLLAFLRESTGKGTAVKP